MCGSHDILKQEGYYVCQNCGTKYAPEEAKKLMIEGTVDVSGSTVKIDNSDDLRNLYELARRARMGNNSENARRYYEQIVLRDPSSWEAYFYSIYFQSLNCHIDEFGHTAAKIINCEGVVFDLIKKQEYNLAVKRQSIEEIANHLIKISNKIYFEYENYYNGIDDAIKYRYEQEYVEVCCAARDIVYYAGDWIVSIFGDSFGDTAAKCWELGVEQHDKLMPALDKKKESKEIVKQYRDKITKYNPKYVKPSKNVGCYIATAVYGTYDCPQVWTLRRYRDYSLAEKWYGRVFIHGYYFVSPLLVKWFGSTRWFKCIWKWKLDRMIEKLNQNGVDNSPYCDRIW